MNPINKKPFGPRGLPQPPKPAVAQLKTARPAPPAHRQPQVPKVLQPKSSAPQAPGVYRPQPPPRVLQTKSSPVAPPVYRPGVKPAVQPKAIAQPRTAPPVYRPEQKRVAQPKTASTIQRHPAMGTQPPRAPIPRSARPGVIQRVMAYRVEYPTYKVQYNEQTSKITGFAGNNDGFGINISFVLPDHSSYFASERNEDQLRGLRLVTFQLDDDLWAAIEWKASGKGKKKDLKQKWVEMVEKLKAPTWSDGASLTKFIKQTALGFNDDWLPVLKAGVKGVASVEYYEDNEDGLGPKDMVFGYNTGEEAEGVELALEDARDQYDTYITVGKARRLGYL